MQGKAYRGFSPKSDDSNSPFSSQIFIVVFGGDVRRTEGGPTKPLSRLPQGGEAKAILTSSLALETEYAISTEKKPTPYPLHLERGKRTRRSIPPIRVRSLPPPFAFDD